MTDNKYHPKIHHRRSIRLKGYNYSQRGAYFITICVQDRACLFGRVVNGQMELNDAGIMIDKWWQKIPDKFPDIALGEYTVMPNHFHAVVLNTGAAAVGADPRVRPCDTDPRVRPCDADPRVRPCDAGDTIDTAVNLDAGKYPTFDAGKYPTFDAGTDMGGATGTGGATDMGGTTDKGRTRGSAPTTTGNAGDILGEHVGSPLHRVVGWFKTMTTNEYIRGVKTLDWPRFNGKLWQRNYYEHIIRNESSYLTISNYIINNPSKWNADKFYISPSP